MGPRSERSGRSERGRARPPRAKHSPSRPSVPPVSRPASGSTCALSARAASRQGPLLHELWRRGRSKAAPECCATAASIAATRRPTGRRGDPVMTRQTSVYGVVGLGMARSMRRTSPTPGAGIGFGSLSARTLRSAPGGGFLSGCLPGPSTLADVAERSLHEGSHPAFLVGRLRTGTH